MGPMLGEHVKKVGNIDVFVRRNALDDYTINLYNGSDCVFSEVYFTSDVNNAVDDSLMRSCDIITEQRLFQLGTPCRKFSNNTYKIENDEDASKQDWFCRVSGTEYFHHFFKSESEFIADKYGRRIIDY